MDTVELIIRTSLTMNSDTKLYNLIDIIHSDCKNLETR